MTTPYTIFLETISDCVLLIAIIYAINMLNESIDKILITYKKRIIIALIISCFISIVFDQNFFDQILPLKLLLIFINFFKYILLTAFIFKKTSVKSTIISLIIQFICSNITSGIFILIPVKEIKESYFINILLHFFIRAIILFLVLYINNKNDFAYVQTITSIIPRHIYLFILLSLLLSDGLIQTANFSTLNIKMQFYIIKLIASFITICLAITVLSLLFNLISQKYQSDISTALEKHIKTQLYHYEQLEKMNTELRKFKHDYTNHMKCISSMALNQEYENILNYTNKLSALFPSSSFLFETGNYIADAILTEKQISSPDNIFIEFEGVIPTDIDNVDLCIILSNALDNAVEACCLCEGNKIINVYSGLKHGYFVLKIKNPTVNINVNDKSATTKSDKINHGFGLANIKRTVKKYDGHISIDRGDNIFTLNIIFSNISDTL